MTKGVKGGSFLYEILEKELDWRKFNRSGGKGLGHGLR